MNTNPAYGTTSAVPMQGTQAGAYPTTGTTMHDPAHPPSALKGNMTSMMGKMTHNPTKEHDGNIMIANAAEQKAARFETKALEWESKGNTAKAQKNREKVRDLLLLLANLYLITRSFPFSVISLLVHFPSRSFFGKVRWLTCSLAGCSLPPEGRRQIGSAPLICQPSQTHRHSWHHRRFTRPQERQGRPL